MNDIQAMGLHLKEEGTKDGNWFIASALVRGLWNARKETGRTRSGEKINDADHGSWLGCVGYMILVDQIGECFLPRNRNPVQCSSDFQAALHHFTRLGSRTINALYALRCAFAHDYSLYNRHGKDASLQHRFQVTQGTTPLLIRFPKTPWDGNFKNRNPNCQTTVNLEKFADVVEGIYRRLLSLYDRRRLKIRLAGGAEELSQRYGVWTWQRK